MSVTRNSAFFNSAMRIKKVPPNKLFMITKVLTSPLKFVKIGFNPHPTEKWHFLELPIVTVVPK